MSYRADKQVITAHTDGRTDTQTDAGNDNTRGQKWPPEKKEIKIKNWLCEIRSQHQAHIRLVTREMNDMFLCLFLVKCFFT